MAGEHERQENSALQRHGMSPSLSLLTSCPAATWPMALLTQQDSSTLLLALISDRARTSQAPLGERE